MKEAQDSDSGERFEIVVFDCAREREAGNFFGPREWNFAERDPPHERGRA
jgi:hypothetical protein